MKSILCSFLVLTACGGCSSTSTSTTPPADPVPVAEPTPIPSAPAEPGDPAMPDPAMIRAELVAAETAAFERAKPVFDRYCMKCHATSGSKASKKKLDHFDMTTYPFAGEHALEISREIRGTLGLTGKKVTMPADKKGAVKGDELALIAAWADAFDASHAGGAHEGQGDHGQGGHQH